MKSQSVMYSQKNNNGNLELWVNKSNFVASNDTFAPI